MTTQTLITAPRPSPAPPQPGDLAVYCRGIVKRFGAGTAEVTALRGIDLEVRSGELMMLVGPSGCGKTTLISVIAGILNQDEGVCRVFGREFSKMNNHEKTRHRGQTVGFVFQAFNLIPALTAVENVAVPLLILGRTWKQALARAAELLDRVGLTTRMQSLPAQLSGGQQQRIAIARALVHDPKLIVCDEPTSALDHETGQKVIELLKEIGVAPGRSLVIVTHDARIFGFADRIARMDDGKVLTVTEREGESP